jgi:hypothetical protein
VVSRHPATLRQVTPALAMAGLSARRVIGPAFLPRSPRREFDLVILDLDVDLESPAGALVEATRLGCPGAPVVAVAGIDARTRLLEALAIEEVCAGLPKESAWGGSEGEPPLPGGVREYELARTLAGWAFSPATTRRNSSTSSGAPAASPK